MEDLIKALHIQAKYYEGEYPTVCIHDVLLLNFSKDEVSEEDILALDELSFIWMKEHNCFGSFKYGS